MTSVCLLKHRKHSGTCRSATFCPQASSAHGDVDGKKQNHQAESDANAQMSHIHFFELVWQAMLAGRDYARLQSECQPSSVSQYLPVVIRLDGVINKGKLQEREQTSAAPPPSICARRCQKLWLLQHRF